MFFPHLYVLIITDSLTEGESRNERLANEDRANTKRLCRVKVDRAMNIRHERLA